MDKCSICGETKAVNIRDDYWSCGACVFDGIEAYMIQIKDLENECETNAELVKILREDIKEAKEEIDKLKNENWFIKSHFDEQRNQINGVQELINKLERYETALIQYADPDNWTEGTKDYTKELSVGPQIAQEALKE